MYEVSWIHEVVLTSRDPSDSCGNALSEKTFIFGLNIPV